MLAARVRAFGAEPVLEEVPEPRAGDGESVVEVEIAPLAHLDLTVLTGTFVHRPPLPYVPGTDGAGVVVASTTHSPGTRVRIRGGGVGLTRDGTWQERAAVPDDALTRVDDDADPTVVATLLAPAATAHVAVHELGGLERGERVAVTGATGAVGSLVVQLARRAGAGEVFGLVGRPEKARFVGGARPVPPGEEPPDGLDLLVDTVGGERLAALVPRVRPGGRVVLVGYTAGTTVRFDLPALLASSVRLLPLSMLEWRSRLPGLDAELLALARSGEISLPVDVRALAELASALADFRNGRVVGRIALAPGRS